MPISLCFEDNVPIFCEIIPFLFFLPVTPFPFYNNYIFTQPFAALFANVRKRYRSLMTDLMLKCDIYIYNEGNAFELPNQRIVLH